MRAAEREARRAAEEKARSARAAEREERRAAEREARRKAEEKARREAEEQVRREAEEKAWREAEDKARREAEEKARREAEEKARRAAETEGRRAAGAEEAVWRPDLRRSREQLAKDLGAEYKKNDRVWVEEEGEDRLYVLLDLGRGMLGWAQLRNPNEGIKRGNLHQPLRDEYAVKLLRDNRTARNKRQAYKLRRQGSAALARRRNRHVGPSSEDRLEATKATERREAEVLDTLVQQSKLQQKNPSVYHPLESHAALYGPVPPRRVEILDTFPPTKPREEAHGYYRFSDMQTRPEDN